MYKRQEMVLIDDGSSDHSLNLCREYQEKDGRVRVYTQENRGVSRTRNRGIELAEGKYIQFVDSDDRIAPDMVEKLVAAMEQEEGIGLTPVSYTHLDVYKRQCYGCVTGQQPS